MISLQLGLPKGRPARVLCLGAHCDDIEIGCGGTLLRFLEERPDTEVRWAIFSSDERRAAETRASARRFLRREPDHKCVSISSFRDGFLPYHGAEVKDEFERLKAEVSPDVVFTHYREDRHQDHRLVSDLTWNTFRNHLVLEYEIPKWDGDLGQPSFFVPLTARHVEEKVEILTQEYQSQNGRAWFEPETFRSLLRLRGLEINAPDRYAEAFYVRKISLGSLPSESLG